MNDGCLKVLDAAADPHAAGQRLDVFINENSGDISRSYAQKLIETGMVTVNGHPEKPKYKIKAGDRIVVMAEPPKELDVEPEDIPLDIRYEDYSIIVVNKPKGMVVHPANGNYSHTLVNALLFHCKGNLSDINGVMRPGIVHRIDKDTSGLLVVAKTDQAHRFLTGLFAEHNIDRVYYAVAEGEFSEERGKVDAPVGRNKYDRLKMAVDPKNGKNAVTHFEVLERLNGYSLLKLQLETGRTHQIRVHMSYIGHPLAGDEVYGRKKQRFKGLGGQVLHAGLLGFVHPVTGEHMVFESELPQYFTEFLDKLRQSC